MNRLVMQSAEKLVLSSALLPGAAVVELGGARRGVGRYLLHVFEETLVLQICGDAGRSERMVADARLDARRFARAAGVRW
jgi:hypothetical protein